MTILTFDNGCLPLICGPFGGGKSALIKFLVWENIEKIACIVVHSQTGEDSYQHNYNWVNERYIHTTWDPDIVKKIISLGKRIKKESNDTKYVMWILDDFVVSCYYY